MRGRKSRTDMASGNAFTEKTFLPLCCRGEGGRGCLNLFCVEQRHHHEIESKLSPFRPMQVPPWFGRGARSRANRCTGGAPAVVSPCPRVMRSSTYMEMNARVCQCVASGDEQREYLLTTFKVLAMTVNG